MSMRDYSCASSTLTLKLFTQQKVLYWHKLDSVPEDHRFNRNQVHSQTTFPSIMPTAGLPVCEETHLPVLGLVDPLRVRPCKAALTVQRCDSSTELRHRVQVCGEIIQHGDDVRGKCCSLCPLFGHPVHLEVEKHTKAVFRRVLGHWTHLETAVCENANVRSTYFSYRTKKMLVNGA